MIDLVLTVCLLANPVTCKKEVVSFDGPIMACAIHGQQVGADWANTHPKWKVVGWKCGTRRIET